MSAWHAIRRNAETSQNDLAKLKARKFGENLPSNLRKLSERLRKGYVFEPAYGATPPKGGGKSGKRPIVVAPLEDRIIQRAILDVLQDAQDVIGVQSVLQTPTSIGGIRGRGVDHAIEIFQQRVNAGDRFVAGSDIAGFFTKIRPKDVISFLEAEIVEQDFINLIQEVLKVELSNENKLSEVDRKLFPTGDDGVAQGCPLSSLAGNIILRNFDKELNSRGITCIRYIDDFIVIGKSERAVSKAMRVAKDILADLGMTTYDYVKSPNKAFFGEIGKPHVFLGYELLPEAYPPAEIARHKLKLRIDQLIKAGQLSIIKALKGRPLTSRDRCYLQTLGAIDNTIHGWRASFKRSKCPDVFASLDKEIDRMLADFRAFYNQKLAYSTMEQRKRAMRVRLLSDG